MTQTIFELELDETCRRRRKAKLLMKLNHHFICLRIRPRGPGISSELRKAGAPFIIVDAILSVWRVRRPPECWPCGPRYTRRITARSGNRATARFYCSAADRRRESLSHSFRQKLEPEFDDRDAGSEKDAERETSEG